ncbi:MAG TPA: MlaD family protein [Solirubrobacteraceae bacterium]|jgi:virulence factor Mce-like protein|nr:MlaD family protein [Solirubrobacteraceae bacterium]
MRSPLRVLSDSFNNPVLTGALTLLIGLVAVYLSYIAQNGLPFVPTYQVSAEVPNADELVKDAPVRIGGDQVGLVLEIVPEPATPAQPHPFARVTMSLSRSIEPLPADSRDEVRLLSVLGGKYLEIDPGHSRQTIPDGGTLALRNANPVVDLDQVFRALGGPKTVGGIRSMVQSLGDALAGRGGAVNASIYNLGHAIAPLQRVLQTLAAPQTDLGGLITGAAQLSSALEPVAPALTTALADGASTFGALNAATPALAATLDQLPRTETSATADLTGSERALADAWKLIDALAPAAPLLPSALSQVDSIATVATPVFHRVPALIGPLRATLSAVDRLATDPASAAAFKIIGNNDLASFSASGFVGLGAILKAAEAGQDHCNIEVPWLLNFSSALSEGDSTGAWLRTFEIFDPAELLNAGTMSSTLHDNFYPREDATDCAAGNEPYLPGQRLGNPLGNYSSYEATSQPPGVAARAASAGLDSGVPSK